MNGQIFHLCRPRAVPPSECLFSCFRVFPSMHVRALQQIYPTSAPRKGGWQYALSQYLQLCHLLTTNRRGTKTVHPFFLTTSAHTCLTSSPSLYGDSASIMRLLARSAPSAKAEVEARTYNTRYERNQKQFRAGRRKCGRTENDESLRTSLN